MTKTSQHTRTKLNLAKETIRTLKSEHLAAAQGGMMDAHTSFSCGRDLCTTHDP